MRSGEPRRVGPLSEFDKRHFGFEMIHHALVLLSLLPRSLLIILLLLRRTNTNDSAFYLAIVALHFLDLVYSTNYRLLLATPWHVCS
jgi:hypothetical protein